MQPLVLALPLCGLEQVPEVPWASAAIHKMDACLSGVTWSEFGWKFVTSGVGYKGRDGGVGQHCFLAQEEFETQRGVVTCTRS